MAQTKLSPCSQRSSAVRQIEFNQDDINQLSYESKHHKHPMVRRRMRALLLKAQGVRHKEIGMYLHLSQTTLRKYFDLYLNGGLEALQQLNYQGKPNHLLQQQEAIKAALEANPPATLKQAQAVIKQVTGLDRSLTQVSEFLRKTNCSPDRFRNLANT
jgi:transposase